MRKSKMVLITYILVISCVASYTHFWTMQVPTPFSMKVIPERIKGESIPGQRIVFLVVVEDEGTGKGDGKVVGISATAPGSTVTVEHAAITAGQVAEITVIPDKSIAGGNVTVSVHGEREGLEQTKVVTFEVLEVEPEEPDGEDSLGLYATEIRDRFIPWLAADHPELGITNETKWTGTIVSPRWLVVTHYLFFSEDWEMHVSWHVMIPPYDWARIDLRHRFTESHPSYAFEISLLEAQEEPHAIDLPESVWR